MADRVAIFNHGKLIQVGTPLDVYERPGTRFVADFVGSSNVLDPDFAVRHGGRQAWMSLRPEKIEISRLDTRREGRQRAEGVVTSVQYQGAVTRVIVEVDGTALGVAVAFGARNFKTGERVSVFWRPDSLHMLEQP
jgi:putative spermidine/putrescine transport system ATP-binding protein